MSTTTPLRPLRSTQDPQQRAQLRRRHAVPGVVGLLPFLVFAVVFGAYPFAQVVRTAFSAVDLTGGSFVWSWNGLANLRTVLAEQASWQAIVNTVVFVVGATIGTLVLGLVLALLVDRAVTLLPLARNLLVWPAVVAPVVVSLMWLLILSPTAGGLNKALLSLGLPTQAWLNSGTGAMASVIVLDLWHWTPVVFLFVYTALKSIDSSMLEAARVDGASERQVIQHIVLPLLLPALGTVALVRVVMGVKAFDEMYLLTAGGPHGATTLVSQHVQQLFFDSLRFGDASAFGLLVVVVTAVVLTVVMFARSRTESDR